MSDTPELDKITKAREEGGSAHIGAFLEWAESKGYRIAKEVSVEITDFWGNVSDETDYVPVNFMELLTEYFDIDMEAADKERRGLMDALIARNEQHRETYTVHPAPEEPS